MKTQTMPALLDAHKKLNMFTGITTEAAREELGRIVASLLRVNSSNAQTFVKIIAARESRCSVNSDFVALAVWAGLIELGDL